MPFLRKYNTLLVTGTTSIRIPIIKRGVVDFAVGADWTPAAGDVKVFVDGAAVANITNLPTAIASGNTAQWEFILTAAELSCKQVLVMIADAATKAVEDQSFIVETYGNASAMYAADLSLANLPANVTQWLGTACATPTTNGVPEVDVTHVAGTAQTAGDIAALITAVDDFVDTEVGAIKTKTDFLPSVTAGAAGGLFIAGANAATSVTTALTANITGNLSGSVNSVTTDVGITQAGADKVWTSASRTLTAFSTALALSVWDVLETAILTASSIGLKLKTNLDAAVSTLATQTSVNTIDDFIDTEVAAIKAKTDQLTFTVANQVDANSLTVGDKTGYTLTADFRIKKNTALANFMFLMLDSTDHITPKTGLTVTATRSLDGAAFAACANAVTELSNGIYKISLAAGDLNADVVTLRFTATGADDRLITIVTQTE